MAALVALRPRLLTAPWPAAVPGLRCTRILFSAALSITRQVSALVVTVWACIAPQVSPRELKLEEISSTAAISTSAPELRISAPQNRLERNIVRDAGEGHGARC